MPKRQLLLQAELIINRLRGEAMVERQHAAFDNNDDVPNAPSYDQLANRQSRCTSVNISLISIHRRPD